MTYVTSDLHGISLYEFKKLLSRANFNDNDFLYILGDVIDRREHGIELLLYILKQANMQLILGNHEAMMMVCNFIFNEVSEEFIWSLSYDKLRLLSGWMNNGGDVTLKALRQTDKENTQDILEYLKEAPLYECITVNHRDFLLVHSGLENFSPDRKISDYSADELIWNRPEITTRYFDDITTVFGHTPTEYYGEEYSGKILKTGTWIDIDTGLKPSLLRLDDLEEFYL